MLLGRAGEGGHEVVTLSAPPNEISPSLTTRAGENAPRLMLRGRAVIDVAARMARRAWYECIVRD